MEPALTGGNTSPLPPRHDRELRLSRVQSMVGGTTEVQEEIIARSLGASRPQGESGGAGASSSAPGAGFGMASEVAAQCRSTGKRERRVHMGGGDVPGIWTCRAEAAEKFPGAQVVLGASHLFSLVTRRRHERRPSLPASLVSLAYLSSGRLRRAHFGTRMLTLTAPVGAWRYPGPRHGR
jgi:hypothetical protein